MQDLGHGETLTYAPWPVADESLLVEATVNLPVQASALPLASNRRRSLAHSGYETVTCELHASMPSVDFAALASNLQKHLSAAAQQGDRLHALTQP